jgi:hypothetical protein
MRRASALAVAVAATAVVLAGCGSESSDTTTPSATAGTSGAQVEVGNTINYGSFGTTADIEVNGKTHGKMTFLDTANESPIALQPRRFPIEFANIYIKELK